MRGLIQRVSKAQVDVDSRCIGAIDTGLLVFLAVEAGDNQAVADKLLHKIINYRVFSDADGKMNLSLLDISGGILVISQFTLAADTQKGLRPSFSKAAPPELARVLYDYFVTQLRNQSAATLSVAEGKFAADMQVHLVNDGPVTFLLEAQAAF